MVPAATRPSRRRRVRSWPGARRHGFGRRLHGGRAGFPHGGARRMDRRARTRRPQGAGAPRGDQHRRRHVGRRNQRSDPVARRGLELSARARSEEPVLQFLDRRRGPDGAAFGAAGERRERPRVGVQLRRDRYAGREHHRLQRRRARQRRHTGPALLFRRPAAVVHDGRQRHRHAVPHHHARRERPQPRPGVARRLHALRPRGARRRGVPASRPAG